MKRWATLLMLLINIGVFAQANTQIPISTILPEDSAIPQSSLSMLQNKMKAILVQNGYTEQAEQRFVLTASLDILEQSYNSAGMLMQKMAITFYVGDVLKEKVYSSATINTVGVGQSETKAYTMAFQRITPSAPQIKQMLSEANAEIMDFYTNHYDEVITETDRLVSMGQYNEAITQLITIPAVCTTAYNDAQSRSVEIFNKKADAIAAAQKAKTTKEGLALIQQAKAAWLAKQDYDAASQALALLAQIDPESGCIDQANAFVQTINNKLRADERAQAAIAKRNWEFKMRQYEDNLEMAKQRQANRAEILGTLVNRLGRFDINYQKDKTKRWGLAKTK